MENTSHASRDIHQETFEKDLIKTTLKYLSKVLYKKHFRGGSRTAPTSTMEHFVIIVNGWKPLTIITRHSFLDVAAVSDPPLHLPYFHLVMIENLTISSCTANKSVTVSWTINQTFPDDVINVTYLVDYKRSGITWEFNKVSNDYFSKLFRNFYLCLLPTLNLLEFCF